ncbi:hypothetical protein [Actinomycetospora sp.]|jgi:hypothetical protein|uniref:hypothetical protein n=1 Tax=Actinomycetospora sp. TaxID=1872135 RepID=UPI002F3E9628
MTAGDEPALCTANDYADVEGYVGQMYYAWLFGYCTAALHTQVISLCQDAGAGHYDAHRAAQLVMTWQLLHSFPYDYRRLTAA